MLNLVLRGLNVVARSVGGSVTHAVANFFDVVAGAGVRSCLRARAQFHRGRRWRIQHREQLVSGEACRGCFAPGVRAPVTLSPHHTCSTLEPSSASAGVLVGLCARMPAGTAPPRWAVAHPTLLAARESRHRGKPCRIFLCAGVTAVAGIERRRRWVVSSSPPRVFDAGV